jgi:phosphoribosylformylglycinamidine (FGAM) synthase PurS component
MSDPEGSAINKDERLLTSKGGQTSDPEGSAINKDERLLTYKGGQTSDPEGSAIDKDFCSRCTWEVRQ